MSWVILLIAVAWAVTFATLLVTAAAEVLSWIPNASVRRWLVIVPGLSVAFFATLMLVGIYFFPETVTDRLREARSSYHAFPTTTIFAIANAAAFVLGLFVLTLWGFWPQRGVPYQPRAIEWGVRRWHRRFWLVALVALCAVLVQDVELRMRLGRMEKRALALAGTLAPPSVPREDNAAIHYQQAIDMLTDVREWQEEGKYREVYTGDTICACDSEERQEYFQRLEPLFDEMRQAAARSGCRFDDSYQPVDVLDGMESSYRLVELAQKLSRHARYMICQQRPGDALADLRAIRGLEDHLLQDPRNAETVFLYWFEAWILDTIDQLATYCDDISVEEARQLFAEPHDVEEFHREVRKWRAAVVQVHLVKTLDGRNYLRPEFHDEFFASPVRRAIGCQVMRLLFGRDEMQSIYSYYPFLLRPEDPDSWIDRTWDDARPGGNIVERAQQTGAYAHWARKANADRQLSNIGIAAALYHQQHGNWPHAMDDLVPDFLPAPPIDSLTDEPFQWMNIDGGVMVYSLYDQSVFDEFDNSPEWWLEVADFHRRAIFLGEAYRRQAMASIPDPDHLCPEEQGQPLDPFAIPLDEAEDEQP